MKILTYIIPEEHQKNEFIMSLFDQFEKKGKLSEKQENALRSAIDIEEDFLEFDFKCPDAKFEEDFNELKAKLKRNRFRYTRTKNNCIKALQSLIYKQPNWNLINKTLRPFYEI